MPDNDIFVAVTALGRIYRKDYGTPSLADCNAWQRWQRAGTAKPARERRRPERPRPLDGLLTADEAAARLRCSVKTLNGYIASGAIRYVAIGHGTKRPRKMFTATDLDDFVANQTRKDVAACPSLRTPVRRSGDSTFRSEVVAFSARPNARPAAKRKR